MMSTKIQKKMENSTVRKKNLVSIVIFNLSRFLEGLSTPRDVTPNVVILTFIKKKVDSTSVFLFFSKMNYEYVISDGLMKFLLG